MHKMMNWLDHIAKGNTGFFYNYKSTTPKT